MTEINIYSRMVDESKAITVPIQGWKIHMICVAQKLDSIYREKAKTKSKNKLQQNLVREQNKIQRNSADF